MTAITAVDAYDVRFPTSLSADGSDAMNKDGDYSAAYVVLRTDDPDLSGFGFTFTIGRGNDLCVAAALQRAEPLIGRDVAEVVGDLGGVYRGLQSDSQLRWLGPGQGRHPSGPRRGDERRVGPGGTRRAETSLATARRDDFGAVGRRRRPALPFRRRSRGMRPSTCSARSSPRATSASPNSIATGTPATRRSAGGWATATTSSADSARRRWTRATATSSSRSARTAPTTTVAWASHGRSSARTRPS